MTEIPLKQVWVRNDQTLEMEFSSSYRNRYRTGIAPEADGCNVVLATCVAVLCAYIAPAAAGSGVLNAADDDVNKLYIMSRFGYDILLLLCDADINAIAKSKKISSRSSPLG
ncbi:hypothetical protein LXL04_028509 [Taraxacum kok-saghyz]